jgi:hypothetical protein
MPRCPDCNKFVSYGDPNTEGISVELNDDKLSFSGEMYLTCGDCSTDLSSASLEDDEDVSNYFKAKPDEDKGETAEYELVSEEIEATDRTADKDRKGKKITNLRYAKRFYGVSVQCTICQTILNKEGETIGEPEEAEIELAAEEQASGFESMS